MLSGFDYGTSNCALGIIQNGSNIVDLMPIDGHQTFMPSSLYALERELISESVAHNIKDTHEREGFIQSRKNTLIKAQNIRSEYGISRDEQTIFTGRNAFKHYIAEPDEGYFIKSPKSFLGASGLRPESIQFFEDIVAAMMQGIKHNAEKHLGGTLTHTVIGRPVNFQGLDASESNRQAVDILTRSAKRAGFGSAEFLYEPLAAGMDFETKLQEDKTVLIVDIGGGTTDCSIVKMGPSHCNSTDRSEDFLGHSGERVGGNDLDIQLAAKGLMPLLGMNSILKNGLRMPTQNFWNAVKINDLGAQTLFNNLTTELQLKQLLVDTQEPELLKRLIHLREEKQNYHLVRSAEDAKIALSDSLSTSVELNYIEKELVASITQQQLTEAIERPLEKILQLVQDAIKQANCQPELVYVTGGSAKSPVIRAAIEHTLGNISVVDGDHFGSVASGLTVWANRIFR